MTTSGTLSVPCIMTKAVMERRKNLKHKISKNIYKKVLTNNIIYGIMYM